ncbi:L,D-transpeptidase [Paenibacillus sp. GP183]|uniref:L,D-transpeptidase family protein n=1 Tax=Paenibacillus sp. GP183 TaxID=1882751 RepID=UPI0008960B23|nr:L,D-transpeptidase [Paenibacillus sp. GP183]SEB76051.1 L,D-transpeptidase catalytic domain [Paenibacillus sp. GP183]
MNDKKNQEQVERFFQHNPFEDPLYLKKYVKDHPDHKMAWYLLGREYAANGKQAKAAYCFAEAGEIYEAFERQKAVVEKEDLDKILQVKPSSDHKNRNKKTARWKWGVLAAFLLFAYIPTSVDNVSNKPNASDFAAATATVPSEVKIEAIAVKEAVSPLPLQSGTRIYYGRGNLNQDLAQMIVPNNSLWTSSLLVEGHTTPDGKWIEWYTSLRILLGVERSDTNKGQSQVQYYDPKTCHCEPADNSKVAVIVENWRQEREEAVVLSSAMDAFQQKTGTLPERAEQLREPYPQNLLPGLTPQMEAMFPKMLIEKKEGLPGKDSQSGASTMPDTASNPAGAQKQNPGQQEAIASSPGEAGASLSSPLQEPLSILVDKDKHRLVLVSGNFVIRNYPVGLGGTKTPEGDFVITEKVRNPNGKSNGDFGSRGMTLSDTLYAIHGTNKPASIGKDESLGCIRMLQADIEELYDMVPQQTKVKIGKGIIPDSGDGKPGEGNGTGKPATPFKAPLQTEDSNPKKTYKWLD